MFKKIVHLEYIGYRNDIIPRGVRFVKLSAARTTNNARIV